MSVPLPPPDSPVWETHSLCTYDTCPVEIFGQLEYRPTLAGNAVLLAIFALAAGVQFILAFRYRTWGYATATIGGCVVELVGYLGRIMLWKNDFSHTGFIIYLVGCTIAPAFFSAAIYLCLSRVIMIYGTGASKLNPRSITTFFVAGDFVSLLLQAIGGALASTGGDQTSVNRGVNIMIGGLSTQVASTAVFMALCAVLAYFISCNWQLVNPSTFTIRNSRKFRLFLFAVGTAALLILERCAYRAAELSNGFRGALANNEPVFMILDGAAMSIVIILLTVFHPGFVMGREIWEAGAFRALPKGYGMTRTPSKAISEDGLEMVHRK